MKVLDNIPLTSILAVIIVIVGGIITVMGNITFLEYCQNVGIALGGLGLLGYARSAGGKG